MTNHTLQSQIAQNKHIPHGIMHSILYVKNPGNYLALIKLFSESDTVLPDHLYQPRAWNVMYSSPRSQNDIISVIHYNVRCAYVVEELRKANICLLMKSRHSVEYSKERLWDMC